MKVKNIKIGIRKREQALAEAKDVMEQLARGEKVKRRSGVYFENLDAMRKVLTEKRMELLHVIKEEHPSSVYDLAKILGRNLTNVTDDLGYLKELGLVDLKLSRKDRKKTVPSISYDKINLEIAV
jgi:predicted transcriptional regulator